jgi:CubicO group peptidase (beta-lactamase class C family)
MPSAATTLLALTLFAEPLFSVAQDLSQQVNRIFAPYDHPSSPGCSLGVIRDGRFIDHHSYGEASLELGVPLSSHSVFYVGSISKQFTAATVVLAAEQGYLSLDDNVRKYIPELPDYGHTITLRQMLNQTSGLRDLFNLLYFSGLNWSYFNSPADILKLIERQKGLNNVPGEEWVYSNTNFFLLGIVVQRATHKTFAEFAAENIFRPLGMIHTRFYDDASTVVPGRVAAYDPGSNGSFLVDWSTTYSLVGAGGLMTTIDDLLNWDNNFYTNRLGKGTLLKELQTPGVLNAGKSTNYGMGLFLGNHRGLPIVEHNGVLFGYRAEILRFPAQKFTVACLCNVSNANPQDRARQVADLYLKDDMQPDSAPVPAAGQAFPDAALFAGEYLDPRTHTIDSFTAAHGDLSGWDSVLRRKNAHQFYDRFGDVLTFEPSQGSMKATLDVNGETFFSGARFSELHLNPASLQPFAGEYRSSELDGSMRFSVEQGNLILRNGGNPPLTLIPIAPDAFEAESSFVFLFERDRQGNVSGLSAFAPSARDIQFHRTH